jgi:hypothetical protein
MFLGKIIRQRGLPTTFWSYDHYIELIFLLHRGRVFHFQTILRLLGKGGLPLPLLLRKLVPAARNLLLGPWGLPLWISFFFTLLWRFLKGLLLLDQLLKLGLDLSELLLDFLSLPLLLILLP